MRSVVPCPKASHKRKISALVALEDKVVQQPWAQQLHGLAEDGGMMNIAVTCTVYADSYYCLILPCMPLSTQVRSVRRKEKKRAATLSFVDQVSSLPSPDACPTNRIR